MSKREKEKARSLDALAKVAYSSGSAPPSAPPKPKSTASAPPRPAPKPAPPRPAPARSYGETEAEKKRRLQAADRKAKLEEERGLKQRRANELARGSNLQWRGMDNMGVPASIRRTGFDRDEPTVSQKLNDILGEAKEKESRAKAKAKGKRQGGR